LLGGAAPDAGAAGAAAAAALDPAALALADLANELGVPGVGGAAEMGMALAEKDSLGIAAAAKPGSDAANAAAAAVRPCNL
jgi:hypothetical protein